MRLHCLKHTREGYLGEILLTLFGRGKGKWGGMGGRYGKVRVRWRIGDGDGRGDGWEDENQKPRVRGKKLEP